LAAPAADAGLASQTCWSECGVYGDGTCPELQKFVHCRNCPVYSTAALQLIDRRPPEGYRSEWSRHFANEKRAPETGNASAILFRIHDEWLALTTHHFQEVAEKRPIHSVPNRPGGNVLGLANIRGELVISISLGHLLQIRGMPPLDVVRQEYERLLVVAWETSKLAFPVHEVRGPHRFHSDELNNSSSSVTLINSRYNQALLAWENRSVTLLNPELLLSNLNRDLG
jgi:chemotaxis-related protein WspD